jgi:Uma2 family endonuclease
MQTTIKPPKSPPIQPRFTPSEYLALEELAESKSEYINGEINPMTGGTTKHNRICINLIVVLDKALRNLNYELFTENVRLWIPQTKIFTYPDVMIIDGEVEYYEERNDTIINPQVIFEVLSPSTQAYDRQDKFEYYRTIPTFKEYLLIDQNRLRVQQFTKKSAKEWTFRDYDLEDENISLTSLELQISLEDIYSKVKLENE